MGDQIVLDIKDVSCKIAGVYILHDLSFQINSGELLAVTGPSGSGKTTLLRIIAGFERLDSGTIVINGNVSINGGNAVPPHKRSCGMIFQDLALWSHMTVIEHLRFSLPEGLTQEEQEKLVDSLLDVVQLADKRRSYPGNLSGGERQRLAIARALIGKPRLLLMDEPFSSLDFKLKQNMISLLETLRKQFDITVVYVTHSLGEIMQMANSVLVIEEGKKVFYGTCGEFKENYNDIFSSSKLHIERSVA